MRRRTTREEHADSLGILLYPSSEMFGRGELFDLGSFVADHDVMIQLANESAFPQVGNASQVGKKTLKEKTGQAIPV